MPEVRVREAPMALLIKKPGVSPHEFKSPHKLVL